MDKSAIKNFSTTARVKLIENIKQRAFELGITKDEIREPEVFQGGFRVGEHVFKNYEKKQYDRLIEKLSEKGYNQVVEEVAYTWFNRFIAIRFMEVNEYLPIGIRVLSSQIEGKTEPDIIQEVTNVAVDLELDLDLVYTFQDEYSTDELFKYIIVKQCNKLNDILPDIFEKIEDYTELLLPISLLNEGSVVRELVTSIPEDNWKEQVEIIGWLYQYYISEKKDEVFADLKKNKKITKENIPAATQLFTPKWIVKYMVENSLGRLWLESHPNEELKNQWKYYIEEADQEPEVLEQLNGITNKELSPEEIKVLDPCMGSGHILVYAFDVLFQIYKEAGYAELDIPKYIIEKNLYGLDIDDRAAQLAYFAIMMKARSYNRRIFRYKLKPNLVAIQESNGIPSEVIEYFLHSNETEKAVPRADVEYLISVFKDAKEFGSLLNVKGIDIESIEQRIKMIGEEENFGDIFFLNYRDLILDFFPKLLKQTKLITGKYDVVVTNPPYMASSGMSPVLSKYIREKYPTSKKDLYSVFIEKCPTLVKQGKFVAMVTMQGWMFQSSFNLLREQLLTKYTISSLVHLGFEAFEEISGKMVQTSSFVFRNKLINEYKGKYVRLVDFYDSRRREKEPQYFNPENHFSSIPQGDFSRIDGKPIVYWLSKNMINVFKECMPLDRYVQLKSGKSSGNNDHFFRYWYEIKKHRIGLEKSLLPDESINWVLINRGGSYRRWYGNIDNVVRKEFCNGVDYFFNKALTWTDIANEFCVRYIDANCASNNHGKIAIMNSEENIYYFMGFLNSVVAKEFVSILTTKAKYDTGYIAKIGTKIDDSNFNEVNMLVKKCIDIYRLDWDSNEISIDFKKNALLSDEFKGVKQLSNRYQLRLGSIKESIQKIISYEERLNEMFVTTFNLQEELSLTPNEKEITLDRAEFQSDIKKLISYVIGCMFGRYSLDQEGLVFAGGQFDPSKYSTFKVDIDNVIPITDDEYFEDDIVTKFIEFVSVTFSRETLEENLDFIAEGLGRKGNETSRQTIRRYFLKDFYNDHVQMYQKRPIYWLFNSGKQDGFKALIYMHRYDESTIARVRTDYLHSLQRKYEAEMARQDAISESDVSPREKTEAMKKIEKLQKQLIECMEFDQVIAHVANQRINIDLDDGVKVNYMMFQNVEVPQSEGKKPLKADLLSPIKL